MELFKDYKSHKMPEAMGEEVRGGGESFQWRRQTEMPEMKLRCTFSAKYQNFLVICSSGLTPVPKLSPFVTNFRGKVIPVTTGRSLDQFVQVHS